MKKIVSIILVATMIFSLAACGASTTSSGNGDTSNAGEKTVSAANDEKIVLSLYAGPWQEIPQNVERMIATYTEEHPNVTIEYYTDAQVLQTNLASKNFPDLFVNTAYNTIEPYAEYLLPLDDQTYWGDVAEDAIDAVTINGKKIMVPLNYEAYGIIYNKKLFADAGFSEPPKTLTEFKTLCENLKANGITPMSLGFKEGWILYQSVMFPFHDDTMSLTEVSSKLKSGEITVEETKYFQDYQEFFDTYLANCDNKSLDTDYTTQCTLFAAGETAMMTNGDWVSGMILEIDPEIDMGLMGLPYTDNPDDYNIYTSVSNCIGVMKDAKNVEAAKEFVNWLATSESGKKWLGEDWGVASPIKSVKSNISVLSKDALTAGDNGQTESWGNSYLPGEVENEFTVTLQKYVMGEIDWKTVCSDLTALIQEYSAK